MSDKFPRLPLWIVSLFTSFLGLGLIFWGAADLGQALQVPLRKNSEGASLPAGARMRIGSIDECPHAYGLAFSPDGKILLTVGPPHAHLWDVATGKPLHELQLRPYAVTANHNSILFSRGGATLLGIASERTLASWDTATGKKIRTICTTDPGMRIWSFVPSFDGNQLVVEVGRAEGVKKENADLLISQLQLWDLAGRKPVRSFQKTKYHKKVGDGFYCGRLAFAPDGKTVAAADQSGTIILWEVATGKILREILTTDFKRAIADVAFSADSRSLISTDCRASGLWGFSSEDGWGLSLRIRDVATGKERFSIPGVGGGFARLSPDGRTVAMWAGRGAARMIVLELLTGQELLNFKAKGNNFVDLAFAPDGKTLASATYDNNVKDVLIWDLIPADWCPPLVPLSPNNLRTQWSALSDNDASAAYRSVLTLSAQPAQTIPFLKARITPIPTARPEHIRQLITDLDADTFKRREAAEKELTRLGPQAETALREALSKSPSLELRKRVEPLLGALRTLDEWVVKDPELLRTIRAIWVLQRIGTPEARTLLEKLADGATAARQTQEAKAALQFLDRLKIR